MKTNLRMMAEPSSVVNAYYRLEFSRFTSAMADGLEVAIL